MGPRGFSSSFFSFLSRAPAPAQGSSSQTVEPQSDDTRPAASAPASCFCYLLVPSVTLPVLSVILSVWQSVCLVCVCSVPSMYTAKSSVPPPSSVFPWAGRGTTQPRLETSDGTVPLASYSPLCSRLTASHTQAGTHTRTQAPPNLDFTRSSHKRSGQGDWPANTNRVGFSNKTPRAAQPLVRSGSTTFGGR